MKKSTFSPSLYARRSNFSYPLLRDKLLELNRSTKQTIIKNYELLSQEIDLIVPRNRNQAWDLGWLETELSAIYSRKVLNYQLTANNYSSDIVSAIKEDNYKGKSIKYYAKIKE